MNDCLSLPLRQGPAGIRVLSTWESLWMPLGEGESMGLPLAQGEGWQPQPVPRQEAASAGRQALWYRAAFNRPDHPGRVLLRFGGAFLAANVWFNGRLLGSHYGYFGPFGFDVSPFLRADNLVVVCCEAPIEMDSVGKCHVLGSFAEGDSRPYPSSAHFGLPAEFPWQVPIGLWRPVELEYVGPVHVDWLRVKPRLDAGDVGRLDLEARLRNLDGREMSGVIGFEVTGPDAAPVRLVREFRLPGGLEQTISVTLSIPQAQRWQPWRLGDPALYQATATVLVDGKLSSQVTERFGFRELELQTSHSGWSVRVNGQPLFLRGANYTPAYQLDTLTEDGFRADLKLAREANLDVLRVHAHVLPEEFYRLADEAGMLVFADFPLTGAYGYHAGGEEARFFERAVRGQIPEMVELLRNRPSIALWSAHDDPPWLASNADLGDVHVVRQNYTLDQEAKALFERLDDSRPALAASGETDVHAYLGWKEGSWEEFVDARPNFVSEYGAPAPPSTASPVWREIGDRWPVEDAEPAWVHAGHDPVRGDEAEVGLPSDYPDLDSYVEAMQAYQAFLVKFATEQLRKHKFDPCSGALAYQLVDPLPGFGFGLVDAARVPKPAYDAFRHAMAPTRVLIDPIGFRPVSPQGFAYSPRTPAAVRLIVVNDDPRLGGVAEVRWAVYRERAQSGGLNWLREAARKRAHAGGVDFHLPLASEPAVQVTSLSLPLRGVGDYRIVAELYLDHELLDEAELEFLVADEEVAAEPAVRELPPYLADRLVQAESLRSEPDGFSLQLLNRTRPAYLAGVGGVRLDGVPVRDARIHLEGQSTPLPRRLDLPFRQPIRLQVDTGSALGPGAHEAEIELRVPGVATGRVRVQSGVGLESPAPPPARGSA